MVKIFSFYFRISRLHTKYTKISTVRKFPAIRYVHFRTKLLERDHLSMDMAYGWLKVMKYRKKLSDLRYSEKAGVNGVSGAGSEVKSVT